MRRTAVMGGGAMGMLLAGKLAAAGVPVELWTRTEEQARFIALQGLTIEEPDAVNGQAVRVRVDALSFDNAPSGYSGFLIVALKQNALSGSLLKELAAKLSEEAVLVLFQNGLGHMERLAETLPGRRLIAAVTTEGALRTGPGSVRHTGRGETWLGEWTEGGDDVRDLRKAKTSSGSDTLTSELESVLNQAGFSVFVSNPIRERMLRKLLINAVINPLSALWRVPNGELPATGERKAVMEALFRETLGILRGNGLRGGEERELWEAVLNVCEATAANRSSMLQDVLAGRETEIDAVNGAVCRLADADGREAPWNAAVTALVKAVRSPERESLPPSNSLYEERGV